MGLYFASYNYWIIIHENRVENLVAVPSHKSIDFGYPKKSFKAVKTANKKLVLLKRWSCLGFLLEHKVTFQCHVLCTTLFYYCELLLRAIYSVINYYLFSNYLVINVLFMYGKCESTKLYPPYFCFFLPFSILLVMLIPLDFNKYTVFTYEYLWMELYKCESIFTKL